MKALILNSGIGHRMGAITKNSPKCMVKISKDDTILSHQLKMLVSVGITEVVMTTGPFADEIIEYCYSLNLPLKYDFVPNPIYDKTNYIYSVYCARDYLLDEDIVLLHGDLVFEYLVLESVVSNSYSCMVCDSTVDIPQKDFKAIVKDQKITKIGIDFFENAIAAQPMYKLRQEDWNVWLKSISNFCESGRTDCYAENAFNEIANDCELCCLDINGMLCKEIDTTDDLADVSQRYKSLKKRTVYMSFSTDIIHSGHISIIKKASTLGELTVGVLSDECISSFKRFPLMPFEERKSLFENINGVSNVIKQTEISYSTVIREMKPDYIVHGDNWKTGFMKPVREEVISLLSTYGGQLIEYPYSKSEKYVELEKRSRAQLSMPDSRRQRLKKLIDMKGCISVLEAHSGITGLIAEKTKVFQDGKTYQFDAIWVSSLCDSTAKGKPDIELVDMTSRFRTIDDIMEVTTKPIIFDGDTGGLTEHFVYTVRSLERMGVSMVIIEDKKGLKKNSLFGTEVEQTQDSIEAFCEKIRAGKNAQKTPDFMICARIESLILERGMDDALERAEAFVDAGADAIMIHSRKKDPDEIFEFVQEFRKKDQVTPLVVVPTSFNVVTEEEFKARGVNVVIYANQLTRSGFPAMQNVAKTILTNRRAKEADEMCMSIKDIITLIPEE